MPGRISLSVTGDPPRFAIEPDGADDLFVSRLHSEFDTGARTGGLEVPAEQFLATRRVVQMLCRQFGVGLSADDRAVALLEAANAEHAELDRALTADQELTAEEVGRRLAGTRFSRRLQPFQLRDLRQLLALPHGANLSVPGSGKTTVAYATYEAERSSGRLDRLLVVSPLSSFDAWETEALECFADPPHVVVYEAGRPIPASAEVVVINYQKLPNPDYFAAITGWLQRGRGHVVLDEVHRIKKGRAGAWGSACLNLAWSASRRDALSGTPAPQHPSDLEALLEFLWPGQSRRILPRETFSPVPAAGIGRRLSSTLSPLHVRTRKSELGLREPEHTVLEFELHGLHREIYLAVTNQFSGAIPTSARERTRLAEMQRVVMYLLEAATNPALLALGSSPSDPPVFHHPRAPIPEGSDLVKLLNEYGRYETPAKFRKLGEIVRANAETGRKTLVWSNFVRNLELLHRDLARYEPAMIHGGVPSQSSHPTAEQPREAELARFRNDDRCMVLLANPAATAEGVSLHRVCHDAVYLERTFNAGQYLQSVDRIHRLGLAPDTETRITFLLTKDTVDEVVHNRVREKAARLGDMLDDSDIATMALPDDDDLEDVTSGFGQPLDDDADLAALFAHLRGEDA